MICDHGPDFGIVAHTASVCSFGIEALVFKTSKILAGGVQSYARMSTVSCTVSVYPLFIVSLVAAAEMLELSLPAMFVGTPQLGRLLRTGARPHSG